MPNEPILLKSIKFELEPGTYHWCSCDNDNEVILCDATHTHCKPLEFEISEKRMRSYCTCKHTATPPFCDGYHKEINAKNFPEL